MTRARTPANASAIQSRLYSFGFVHGSSETAVYICRKTDAALGSWARETPEAAAECALGAALPTMLAWEIALHNFSHSLLKWFCWLASCASSTERCSASFCSWSKARSRRFCSKAWTCCFLRRTTSERSHLGHVVAENKPHVIL